MGSSNNGIKSPLNSPPSGPRRPDGSPYLFGGWLWFLGLLLLLNYLFGSYGSRVIRAQIPYSRFKAELQANNIKSVVIDNQTIDGVFRRPLSFPVAPSPFSRNRSTHQLYSDFATIMPAIGDPSLLDSLEAHHASISAREPSSPWLLNLLNIVWPFALILIVWFWLRQLRGGSGMGGVFGFGQSRARLYSEESPRVTFNDIAGEEESKQELAEIVDFLKHPEKYHRLGGKIPKGVLLVGPPGTGKTLLARAVAGEAGVPFYSISASEFVEMFVGVGASRVRDLFSKAKESSPAIVFLDEIDAVGRQRGAGLGGGNDEREQTLNQLLVEMDGFDPKQEVIVVAATNRPDVLDPALLRPGRFDRQVTVGLPDRRGREGILKIHTREVPLASDVDLTTIARATPGMAGADLANLVNEAALLAARRNKDRVTEEDMNDALDKIVLGVARSMLMSEHERLTVAYHEAGHAIVAIMLPDADPVHKVTIIPHGMALGVTEQLPEDDRRNYPRQYLDARICVMMGGRSAEEIALCQMTTGAENDFKEATRLARKMVTEWGMSEQVGAVAYRMDEDHPFLGREVAGPRDFSESTAAVIDAEVRRLLEGAHERARSILNENRSKLDDLVQALLKEETVGSVRLEEIVGKPVPRSESQEIAR